MIRYILAAMMFSLVACTNVQNVVCPVFQSENGALVSAIAAAGNCTGTAAILSDLQAAEVSIKVCPAPAAKPGAGIVSDICSALVPVAATAIGSALPKSWQCSLSGSSTVTTLLQQACGLIPVTPAPAGAQKGA